MNSDDSPKASSRGNACHSAWLPAQKKTTHAVMSCGASRRYGSSLLLKTADFSIQDVAAFGAMRDFLSRAGEEVFMRGLLCGLFKGSQHGITARHGRIERFLGGLLPGKRSLHFLGPDVTHLPHVSE